MDTRQIFGLNISAVTPDVAAQTLERHIRESNPVRLAFVNANLANMAYEDVALHSLLQDFLLLNDGIGIDIASRILHGKPFPCNLNGTDFVPFFLRHCSRSLRLFLLGATPSVVERAANGFTRCWPVHRLVGYQHGFFAGEESRILELVKNSAPDLVLVAMGNGLQERMVARLVPEVAVSAWAVGGLFDFLAGDARRAPVWLRDRGLEWCYRMLQEPRRLGRRYLLGNPSFMLRVLHERISRPENA